MNAEELKKLAGEYAHVYAFVGDDTMPRKHRELNLAIDEVFEERECLQIQLDFLKDTQAKNIVLAARLAEVQKDAAHWKNNHETEVRRARILKERPDMPIERVQAYEQWGKDLLELGAKQAKIDALMLEYCPDDMTTEQFDEWASRQRPVSDEEQASTQAIVDEALRPYRAALQAEGRHPAPCARHCEANAFRIQERTMQRTIDDLRAEVMRLTAELKDMTRSK